MSYIEQQSDEITVLASIYADELEIISSEPPPSFILRLTASAEATGTPLAANVYITFPDTYPDVVPQLRIQAVRNMSDGQSDELHSKIMSVASENLGSPMIFTLAEAVKEWLDANSHSMYDQMLARQRHEEMLVGAAETEEKERKLIEELNRQAPDEPITTGTPVSKENFQIWKAAFDAEMNAGQQAKAATARLTGRQMFERDATLADSDASFIGEGDATADIEAERAAGLGDADVAVDESLFDADEEDV